MMMLTCKTPLASRKYWASARKMVTIEAETWSSISRWTQMITTIGTRRTLAVLNFFHAFQILLFLLGGFRHLAALALQ